MPMIVAKKDFTCRACGGRGRRGEYADFTAELGMAHPEPQCAQAAAAHRPNERPGRCGCGSWVAAKQGHLVLLRDDTPTGGRKHWAVQCGRCAGR